MLKRYKPCVMTEEGELKLWLCNWVWDSHNWVEESPEYAKCRWCDAEYTSQMSARATDALCPKNPAVLRLLQQAGCAEEGEHDESTTDKTG